MSILTTLLANNYVFSIVQVNGVHEISERSWYSAIFFSLELLKGQHKMGTYIHAEEVVH